VRPSLADVAGQRFDVIVIGGGINGAGIARAAQRAGFRTLLIERNDFAAGTTSRATRLIHGGLRYLEHGELGLVYESLREREELLLNAPHLVRPLRLLLPVYEGDARPPWKVRAGLALYDALSLRKSLPRHRAMPPTALNTYEPGLNTAGLRAAYSFFDAQVEFPERLTVETVLDLIDAAGTAMNHASATGILSPGGMLRGVRVRDECSGEEREVEAPVVVNAAGPWVDAVLCGTDAQRHDALIGGTKGSHLVVEWPRGPRHAVFATAHEDGRPFFILPWYRYTLVGTTDVRYDGDPADAHATSAEIEYLLRESNRLFPGAPLSRHDILYTYCGVRPLPFTLQSEEAAVTRRHFVVDHAKTGGPDGLLSIVGGKLTTFRSLGRIATAAIAKHARPSLPADESDIYDWQGAHDDGGPAAPNPLSMYGRRAADVLALASSSPLLGERICEHNPEVLAQVAYAVDREMAVTVSDVLLRRLPCGWSACHALDGAPRVAAVMGERLRWDDARVAAEVAAYGRELARTLTPIDAAAPARAT
jgi:glycerol-3-phosphate dehydrogenase